MRLTLILLLLTALVRPTSAQQGGSAAPSYRFDPTQSLLLTRMIRTEEPPPSRSVRMIEVLHADVPQAPIGLSRTREQALELAATLAERGRQGESMATLARRYSSSRNAVTGGVLGTYAQGVLSEPFDAFLFSAEVGEISDPIETPTGVFVLERLERYAAARTIMVRGTDEAAERRMAAIETRLSEGVPFAEVATELSEDELTASREGILAIYERGPEDRLLKAAAFDAEVGEVVGPIVSPLGLHLVKRVPIDELPDKYRERTWARFSAIVLVQSDTVLPIPTPDRNHAATADLAEELYARLQNGESFEDLALAYNDDFGDGRERRGDLGWVHRQQPGLSPALTLGFRVFPGELLEPQPTNFGWMILRRDV